MFLQGCQTDSTFTENFGYILCKNKDEIPCLPLIPSLIFENVFEFNLNLKLLCFIFIDKVPSLTDENDWNRLTIARRDACRRYGLEFDCITHEHPHSFFNSSLLQADGIN